MSTSTPNRVRAGVSTGGQFATGARGEPPVSLALPHRPVTSEAELAKAQADQGRLEKKAAKATRRAATFELANLAQIAVEHSKDSTELVLRRETDHQGAQRLVCVAVFDEDGENPVEPARWWSEDLERMGAADVESTGWVGGWSYWRNEPIADVSIDRVLAEEKKLIGKAHDSHSIYTDHRGDARQAMAKARAEYARATTHALLADADQHLPGVSAMTVEADDEGGVVVTGLLDEHREDFDDEDDDYLAWLEAHNEPIEHLGTKDLVDAGVGVPQQDGTVIVPMDAVRRLRGAADDPNQQSLFGREGDLSQYGWTGQAA